MMPVNTITSHQYSYQPDHAYLSDTNDQIPSDSEVEVIVFYSTPSNLEEIRQLARVITVYRYLQAAIVSISIANIESLPNSVDIVMVKEFERQIQGMNTDLQTDQDTQFNSSYLHSLIGLQPLFNAGYTGQTQNYTQIDDGITGNHSAFEDRVLMEVDFSDNETTTCGNHGTAVAGVAAAESVNGFSNTRGASPDAGINSIGLGCGEGGFAGDFLAAYNFIIAHNSSISVVNTSLGGNGFSIDKILQRVSQSGVLIVGSAGNSGPEFGTTGNAGPGNSIHAVSVGATNATGHVASFSSRGYAHNLQLKPDVVAPGVGINTTKFDGTTTVASGTSLSSPMVAGSLVTLNDAITQNGFSSNPGLLKAAVMKGASRVADDQRVDGHGLVNISKSWMLIQSASTYQNIPQLVELSPNEAPNPYIDTVAAGGLVKTELTQISSVPSRVQYNFTGELTGRLRALPGSSDYSQSRYFEVNTTGLNEGDFLTGEVIATVGKDQSTVNLNLTIGEEFKGDVAIDLRHTWWDLFDADTIGGGNIGKMAELAMEKGYTVTEVTDQLNSSILHDFEVVWMPDPVNWIDNTTNELVGTIEYPLLDTEITALHNFVKSGGSLLIDFIGTLTGPAGDIHYVNATSMNRLTSEFGISVTNDTKYTPVSISPAYASNTSSLLNGVDYITHFGNYLKTDKRASAMVTNAQGKTTVAGYTGSSGGRVVVTSTNFWLDNHGINGSYAKELGLDVNDNQLADNVWEWFNQSHQIAKLSTTEYQTYIEYSFYSNQDNFQIRTYDSEGQLLNLKYNLEKTVDNQYRLTIHTMKNYRLVIATQDDYVAWAYHEDKLPPKISVDFLDVVPRGDFEVIRAKLSISDNSELLENRFAIFLDGIQVPINNGYYTNNNREVDVLLPPSLLEKINASRNGLPQFMSVYASDDANNIARMEINLIAARQQAEDSFGKIFYRVLLIIFVTLMVAYNTERFYQQKYSLNL